MKSITFNISKDGNVTVVDAVGYGPGCTEATRNVERRLGVADNSSRAPTENMYKPEIQTTVGAGLG